ncbi:hypothetical protein LIA77_09128 [Sarocladium implicatum]|nr:hypothetical protein LIA77_09128 [Sarocladium implicatum]
MYEAVPFQLEKSELELKLSGRTNHAKINHKQARALLRSIRCLSMPSSRVTLPKRTTAMLAPAPHAIENGSTTITLSYRTQSHVAPFVQPPSAVRGMGSRLVSHDSTITCDTTPQLTRDTVNFGTPLPSSPPSISIAMGTGTSLSTTVSNGDPSRPLAPALIYFISPPPSSSLLLLSSSPLQLSASLPPSSISSLLPIPLQRFVYPPGGTVTPAPLHLYLPRCHCFVPILAGDISLTPLESPSSSLRADNAIRAQNSRSFDQSKINLTQNYQFIMTEPLQKVDSAVQGLDSPVDKKKEAAKRRQSSAAAPGVSKIQELGMQPWMVNTSPTADHVEDPAVLDEFLTDPPIKRIDLWFELGDTSVSASNFKGVTIKDALKAIHKRYKTKVSGHELGDAKYLKGFIWEREHWTRLQVVLAPQKTIAAGEGGGGKKKGKKGKKGDVAEE